MARGLPGEGGGRRRPLRPRRHWSRAGACREGAPACGRRRGTALGRRAHQRRREGSWGGRGGFGDDGDSGSAAAADEARERRRDWGKSSAGCGAGY
ncbi:hypothetical protein PR202_ga11665 [Eleusine coracana subsp. coracana]|uniref:Uncharacterized protein n=1 Tax=Eleusine coracana subsp. coracana TaxID=191504 RepID=A0AAV5CA22_ELECO|nr:hypothetical protein PR202_ga11665 [Eleusine coracana subsp. coracana]